MSERDESDIHFQNEMDSCLDYPLKIAKFLRHQFSFFFIFENPVVTFVTIQINWIKDKIRELQQFQSDTLLQTRLNWYEGILNKNKEETTIEENTNHKGIGFLPILYQRNSVDKIK